MAKKSKKRKKQQRRHHFVQTNQASVGQPKQQTAKSDTSDSIEATNTSVAVEQPSQKTVRQSSSNAVDQQLAERIHYMKRDARLTAVIGGSIMIGLIILWILFDHTGLGPHIYRLITIT